MGHHPSALPNNQIRRADETVSVFFLRAPLREELFLSMSMTDRTAKLSVAPTSRPIAAKDSLLCITLHHAAEIKPFAMRDSNFASAFRVV
ncbi:MAG: hypothetical protein ABIK08_00150 [Pseudomonadota bacterium]